MTKKAELPREPPARVLEQLRKEVNFGCPVRNCGKPYLKWHHFDPPWHIKHHQNPDGMIALCSEHTPLADGGKYGGRWTVDQLKKMKKNPFLPRGKISADYGFLREKIVCKIGNIAYNVTNVLEIDWERVIGFGKDSEGNLTMNMLFRDHDGKPILVMKNNFWVTDSNDLFDLICPPGGKELKIISKDKQTSLTMRFDDFPASKFRKDLLKQGWAPSSVNQMISDIGNPPIIPVWSFRGKVVWQHTKLHFQTNKIRFKSDKLGSGILRCGYVGGSPTAFSFQEDSLTVG